MQTKKTIKAETKKTVKVKSSVKAGVLGAGVGSIPLMMLGMNPVAALSE